MIKEILVASVLVFSGISSAENFSWQEYKTNNLEEENEVSVDKSDDGENYVYSRYGVKSTKKTINQMMKDNLTKTLFVGLEMNMNPSYDIITESLNPNPDPLDPSTIILQTTTTESLEGIAIFLKGDLDLSPIGFASTNVNAKVALSNNYIDLDINKRLIGQVDSILSMEAGAGIKAVTSNNDVFDKGFYGYGNGSTSISYDNMQVTLGGRYLFTKPKVYKSSDKLSPFLSGSFTF